MRYLADVNVWLNAVSAVQPGHAASAAWFESVGEGEVNFCRVTMLGMLRLLTNTHAMRGHPVDARKSWDLYRLLRDDSRVRFLEEPETMEAEMDRLLPSKILNGADWTDHYLTAFALASASTLVTFDQGFRRFPTLKLLLLG